MANFDGVEDRGVGSVREEMNPTAERIGREIADMINRYADRDPAGKDTYDVLVGVAFAVATLALSMPGNVRWMFFQMIVEQGQRLEIARRNAIIINNVATGKA